MAKKPHAPKAPEMPATESEAPAAPEAQADAPMPSSDEAPAAPEPLAPKPYRADEKPVDLSKANKPTQPVTAADKAANALCNKPSPASASAKARAKAGGHPEGFKY